MAPLDPNSAKELLEAFTAAFAVLGGVMAYFSGYAAYRALAQDEPPSAVAHSINEGVGNGFGLGAPPVILLPAILIAGTAHVELRLRARQRFDRS